MDQYQIEAWFVVKRLTSGRRSFAAKRVAEAARMMGLSVIAQLCDQVSVDENAQLERLRVYSVGRANAVKGSWTPEILAADTSLDRLLTTLRDLLAALAALQGTPRGDAAKGLLDDFFGEGVTYYTHQPIVEQDVRVEELLNGLTARASDVETATVQELVAQVKASHAQYQALVHTVKQAARLTFGEVKAGNLANHRRFLEIVAAIFADTRDLPEAQRLERRAALLAPVVEQDKIVSELMRRRRRVTDVDPVTGEPEPDGVTLDQG